jgi:hypothetical protein
MPRNSKAKEDDRAQKLLDECLADYAKAHPEPRSSEAAIILKRLNVDKDDVDFARAFARVADASSGDIIDWMVTAIGIQRQDPKEYHAKMKIIEDGVAALPLVIRAAELAYPVSNRDIIDHLKRLDFRLSLTLQINDIEQETISPPRTHSPQDALRYFVRMIDRHVRENHRRARTADLASLASVAFNNEITENAITAVREP